MTEIKKNWFEKIFTSDFDTKVNYKKRFWFLILSPFVIIGLFLLLTYPGMKAPLFFMPIIIFSLCLKLYALKTLRQKYQSLSKVNEDVGLKNMVIIIASVVFWLLVLLALSVYTLSY